MSESAIVAHIAPGVARLSPMLGADIDQMLGKYPSDGRAK